MAKRTRQKCCIPAPVFRKPNFFLYGILYLATIWAKLHYRVRYDKTSLQKIRQTKGPVLLVGTHHGALDFAYMVHAMYPRRMSIVTAANTYYNGWFGSMARAIRTCIPIQQFSNSYRSIRDIRKMLDAGVSVAIYPAGRYSIDGRNGRVSHAFYKLVKWLGVPVVVQKYNMSYQTRPRYASEFRRGKVMVETELLFSAEDCATLSVQEVQARLEPRLQFNDFEYQARTRTFYKSKAGLAKGLEDLLYQCPQCKREFTQVGEGDALVCTACGNTALVDGYGALTPQEGSVCPRRIDLWYDAQYVALQQEILSTPDYRLEHIVRLFKSDPSTCGFTEVETGTLSLDTTGLTYCGANGTLLPLTITTPPAFSIDLLGRVDIYHEEEDVIYRFIFDGPEKPAKLNAAIEIIHDYYLSKGV